MKKTTVIIAAFFGLFCFASCKKDYHCTCTYNGTTVYDQDLGKLKKSDAESQCNAQSTSVLGQTWACGVK